MRPASAAASGAPVDGGDPRRHCRRQRGGVRGQIHAAVVVLGRRRGREAYRPAPAQHVGDHSRLAALSVITGGGKWVEIKITADSLYQHLLLTAEKKFWRCVESGEPPRLFGVEPRARI